jgi:hypothetical protein
MWYTPEFGLGDGVMALIRRLTDAFQIQIQFHQQQQHILNHSDKIMDLSDSVSISSGNSSSPPPQMKHSGARRGRPRLTEDAELAKLVFTLNNTLTNRKGERN